MSFTEEDDDAKSTTVPLLCCGDINVIVDGVDMEGFKLSGLNTVDDDDENDCMGNGIVVVFTVVAAVVAVLGTDPW